MDQYIKVYITYCSELKELSPQLCDPERKAPNSLSVIVVTKCIFFNSWFKYFSSRNEDICLEIQFIVILWTDSRHCQRHRTTRDIAEEKCIYLSAVKGS